MIKDRFNLISLLLIIVGVIVTWILLSTLSGSGNADTDLTNKISIIGSICSIVGIVIAFIQIYKIASNSSIYESTFVRTLAEIKKNDLISLVTRAVQQVSVIKVLLEKGNIEKTVGNFNQLMIDLSLIQKYDIILPDKEKLDEFISFCADMETALFIKETIQEEILREKYTVLTQIQRYLTTIEPQIKTPNKN